jgi:hypothetical protein
MLLDAPAKGGLFDDAGKRCLQAAKAELASPLPGQPEGPAEAVPPFPVLAAELGGHFTCFREYSRNQDSEECCHTSRFIIERLTWAASSDEPAKLSDLFQETCGLFVQAVQDLPYEHAQDVRGKVYVSNIAARLVETELLCRKTLGKLPADSVVALVYRILSREGQNPPALEPPADQRWRQAVIRHLRASRSFGQSMAMLAEAAQQALALPEEDELEFEHQAILLWADTDELAHYLGTSEEVEEVVANLRFARAKHKARLTPRATVAALGKGFSFLQHQRNLDRALVNQFLSCLDHAGLSPHHSLS